MSEENKTLFSHIRDIINPGNQFLSADNTIKSEESPNQITHVPITDIYNLFCQEFEIVNNKVFDPRCNDGETKKLAYTLLYYFFNVDNFLDSPLIDRSRNEKSMSKGLFIAGGYGCGKTMCVKTIASLSRRAYSIDSPLMINGDIPVKKLMFKVNFMTANEAVDAYEMCGSSHERSMASDKKMFWNRVTKGPMIFDDVMTEREASNYGKVEIFKDIFEKRYDAKARTIITANLVNKSLDHLLNAMEHRYGPRAYDRLFEMFNFIVLKGKSLRK